MKILIDTDVFVALTKENDTNHLKSVEIAEKFKNAQQIISPLTIPEVATVLSHKLSQTEAVIFLEQARKKKFEVIPLTKELEDLAGQIFISQKNKNTSWTDCLNIAIARDLNIDAIFSFDTVYQKNGFTLLQ